LVAETYCNGIPVSNVTDDAPTTTTFSTAELYAKALQLYDSALATLSTSGRTRCIARARASERRGLNVDINQYDKAAQVLGAGGDGAGSTRWHVVRVQRRDVQQHVTQCQRRVRLDVGDEELRCVDKEGINGWITSARGSAHQRRRNQAWPGQDGTLTPLFNQFPNLNSPVMLASGIEARMIEAGIT
jgi:hypothetical protein